MKKILLLATAIILCFSTFAQKTAQSIRYEGMLAQVISQERFTRLQNETPSKLVATYFEVTQFCYVSDKLPEGSRMMGDICDYLSPNEVCDNAAAVVAAGEINHYKYTFDRDEVRYTAYAIGSTGYYAILSPQGEYNKKRIDFMKQYGF